MTRGISLGDDDSCVDVKDGLRVVTDVVTDKVGCGDGVDGEGVAVAAAAAKAAASMRAISASTAAH